MTTTIVRDSLLPISLFLALSAAFSLGLIGGCAFDETNTNAGGADARVGMTGADGGLIVQDGSTSSPDTGSAPMTDAASLPPDAAMPSPDASMVTPDAGASNCGVPPLGPQPQGTGPAVYLRSECGEVWVSEARNPQAGNTAAAYVVGGFPAMQINNVTPSWQICPTPSGITAPLLGGWRLVSVATLVNPGDNDVTFQLRAKTADGSLVNGQQCGWWNLNVEAAVQYPYGECLLRGPGGADVIVCAMRADVNGRPAATVRCGRCQ